MTIMINRTYVYISLLLLLSIQSQAQISLGVRGGVNINRLGYRVTGSADGNGPHYLSGSNTGYHAGVFGRIPLSQRLSLAPELLYTQRGASYKMVGVNGMQTNNLVLHYIELPLLFHYKIFRGLHAEFGPDLGVLLSGRYRQAGSFTYSLSDQNIDAGLNAGLRYYVLRKLFLTARYRQGLMAVQTMYLTDEKAVHTGKGRTYNQGFMAGVGFGFR